ncbi:metallophosphoesterase family protein [Halobellus clavatus]|jgi:Icc-related predicted phosphoesterase|uniref:Predicted phosphoesterase n=1 Tax=Halobellus clavatus TaxID=660517 RepID=A0A1H3GNZ3_9EURY|nr:metallophosphoesterase [Halobellus clavatus]SDY05043.1 Predicted phosphoesterase [Halobellus clavatus]
MGVLTSLKEKLNQESRSGETAGMEKDPDVTRLFYATDVHGSSACWRKFVNSADFYDADVLVLGGDTTGKAIFPIVDEGDRYTYSRQGDEHTIDSDDELDEFIDSLKNTGYYPYVMDESEYEHLQSADDAEERQNEIFLSKMKERIHEWIDFADERLDDTPVYACPGNDDPFEIDEVWQESEQIDLVEGEVVDIGEGYEMASTGWTHPTPWDTDREEPEEQLRDRLERVVSGIDDYDRAIFNFHEPPYDSQLDEAPELDEELRPKFGAQSTEPVGSEAVRNVIEEYQPPLSLHGHIHESRGHTKIGDTDAINPGSVYSEGSLQGAIVDLQPKVDVVGLVRG